MVVAGVFVVVQRVSVRDGDDDKTVDGRGEKVAVDEGLGCAGEKEDGEMDCAFFERFCFSRHVVLVVIIVAAVIIS